MKMKYLNNEVIDQLNKQQELIINSNDDLIMVEACPGAGKTHTIVQRIKKELIANRDDIGIIACSFTNEASKELEKRIEKKSDISNSYIGTIDSFILSEIILKYINRYLKFNWPNYKKVIIDKFVFPDNYREINELTRFPDRKQQVIEYYNKWLGKLITGVYEISFPSYILATKIIRTEYFSNLYQEKYSTIYIDEAQDLNYYQHIFINELRIKTGIKVVMVGDPYQSIYQFRGANPELFKNLEKNGYIKYAINVSVRCHPSISYYANKITNNLLYGTKVSKEKRVSYIKSIDLNFIKKLTNGFFIICETNELAINLFNTLKNEVEVYYVKPLDIINDDYKPHKDIIEEIIKCFYNCNNPIPKYIYLKETLYKIIKNINNKIKKEDININGKEVEEYISYLLELLGISISNETLAIIKEKLKEDVYKYYYYLTQRNNRIMTIHLSKGLENSDVIICLENQFSFNDEYRSKLFVAMTRAIDNVYIFETQSFAHHKILSRIIEED